jgi:hypothetical protein
MNRFLKYWRITGGGEIFRAQVINYADDFVILSRGYAMEALNWTRSVITWIGLTLNEAKTGIQQARTEQFDFPWIYLRAAASSEEWPGVPRGESVEEERFPATAESGRSTRTLQHRAVVRRARSTEQNSARLVQLLRLRDAVDGVSSGRSLRLRPSAALSATSPQGGIARHLTFLGRGCVREVRSAAASGCPPSATSVSLW